MALKPVELILRATGGNAAVDLFNRAATAGRKFKDELKGVSREGQDTGRKLKDAGQGGEEFGRKTEAGARKAETSFRGVGREVHAFTGSLNGLATMTA